MAARILRRAFIAAGLYALAIPGLVGAHASTWEIIGTGCLAGCIAGAVGWEW